MLNIINILYVYFLLKYTRIYKRTKKYLYDDWSEWEKYNKDGKIELKIITLILISIYLILIFFSFKLQILTLILLLLFNFVYLFNINLDLFYTCSGFVQCKLILDIKIFKKISKFLNKKISI